MRNRVLLNLIAFSCTANAFSQDVVIGARGQAPRVALQEQAFEREMAVLIDDMQRVCDLSEQQVRKLNLAAKGAVRMAMASYKKKMQQLQGMLPEELNLALPVPEVEADGDGENEVADEQEKVGIGIAVEEVDLGFEAIAMALGGPGGGQPVSPMKQPLWEATVSKVLTKEQREKYAARVKARKVFARRASVAKFVARVDARLLLSDEQRDKLIQIVDAEVGDLLIKDDPFGNVVFMPAGETPPVIAEEQLKALLSEPQFSVWKRSFAGELSTRKMMQGIPLPGQAGGAIEIQINGAPVLQP